jgi:hypothetical protein
MKSLPKVTHWDKRADGRIYGVIRGDDRFRDGSEIRTSVVLSSIRYGDSLVVGTESGSKYELTHPDGSAWFGLRRVLREPYINTYRRRKPRSGLALGVRP